MTRYSDDGYENFPNESAFWSHRMEVALRGKRGRKALAELRKALLALPEHRLIAGAISTVGMVERTQDTHSHTRSVMAEHVNAEGEGVCVVGAYLWHKRIKEGMTSDEAFASLPIVCDDLGDGLYDTALVGERAGLTYSLAWFLADRNDETFAGLSPEQRYDAFLAWLDTELGASETVTP